MNKTMPRTRNHLRMLPNALLAKFSKDITDTEERGKVIAEMSRRRKNARRV